MQRIAYRFRRDGFDPLVLPPTTGDETSPSLSVDVKHARHATPRVIHCDITGDLVSLRWTKSTAQISFQPQSLFAPDINHHPIKSVRACTLTRFSL
jgi:hypothetical protein